MIKVIVLDPSDPEEIREQFENGNADVVIAEAFLDENKGHFCHLFALEGDILRDLRGLEELTEMTPINSNMSCFSARTNKEGVVNTLRKIGDVEIV